MKRSVSILVVGLIGITCLVHGKVFRAIGTAEGRLNTAGLMWESAYQTTMNINGKRNELHVYSAHRHEAITEQIKDRFEQQGAKVLMTETHDGAQGLARWSDREARILVLSSSTQPNQMIFLFYPEPGEARADTRLPIPDYPGARAVQTVANESTGTISATLETDDRPEQVQAFYAGALSARGWRSVIPATTGSSRMAMYQKKEQICTILSAYRPEGSNRVTLLVKGRGL